VKGKRKDKKIAECDESIDVSENIEIMSEKEDQLTTPIDSEILLAPRNSCSDALAFELTNNLQTESLNSNEFGISKAEKNVDVREDGNAGNVPKNSVILSRNDHIVASKEEREEDNNTNTVIDENALCQKIMTDSDDMHVHQEEPNNDQINSKLIKGFAKGFENVINKQNKDTNFDP
jgi:hypothetical protein